MVFVGFTGLGFKGLSRSIIRRVVEIEKELDNEMNGVQGLAGLVM